MAPSLGEEVGGIVFPHTLLGAVEMWTVTLELAAQSGVQRIASPGVCQNADSQASPPWPAELETGGRAQESVF